MCPWGQGLSPVQVQAPLEAPTWTRPSPPCASVSPSVKGQDRDPGLRFSFSSASDLLGGGGP